MKILQYFSLPSYQIFRGKMLHKNAVIFALFHRYIIDLRKRARNRRKLRVNASVFLLARGCLGSGVALAFAFCVVVLLCF